MTLAAGTRLGPYEILAPIGAGGMGEVFRARDPRLSREVAVKVLPASLSTDPERLRRFEQEARAAGTLNHPNVTAVFDIGSHEGAPYIVEELLEGETLRSVLAGGRLPLRKAVEFAVQIARGLGAAHEKGIVHRDLKPENVFVTKDGRVKILDFGLARVTLPGGARDATALPTATGGTDPGTVLGTLGYMSPEQLRGQGADARSDLFSFGAILYEMLAGARAFRGDSAADTISAILREEPADLSVTNKGVPPGLERIVRHCLEKSPEQRFQSARDVAFDLEALSTATSGAPLAASSGAARAPRKLLLPLAALALVAAGFLADRALAPRAGKPPTFTALTFRRGLVQNARFAPDGKTVVYGASWNGGPFQLFSTRGETVDSRPLGVEGDVLAVSSGGDLALSLGRRFTLGWESAGTLARMPLDGGAPREVFENVEEADWSPDGKSLLVVRDAGTHFRIEYPIGKTLYESDGWISNARLSRQGDRIAFIEHPQRGDNVGSICVVDLSGKKTILWARGGSGVAWSPDGREVWGSGGGNLFSIVATGSRRLLARIPGTAWLLDVAPNGNALFAHADIRREMEWVGRPGERGRILSWFNWSYPGDLSADGKTVLFDESIAATDAGYPVFLRKTDGAPAVQLGEGAALALSTDGRWALSVLRPFGETQLALFPTGAGQPRTLPQDAIHYVHWGAFLPDGRNVIVAGNEKGRGLRLWVRPLEGGAARPVTPEGIRARFILGAVSPDGTLVATAGPEDRLALYQLAGGAPRLVPGALPGETLLRWGGPSSLLLASTTRELPVRITRLDVTTGKREPVRELAPSDPSGIFSMDPILATPDASAFVTSYRRLLSTLYLVEGLK